MHQARKRFGQNFLHDQGVISRIVRSINPKPGEALVEIGPGLGALTELLLEATDGQLDVVELDRDLIPVLRTKFFNYPNFRIHEADALRFDFASLKPDRKSVVLGKECRSRWSPYHEKEDEHVQQILVRERVG